MELSRLLWACRRGMLELDLLFLPYAQEVYAGLSLEKKEHFDALLKLEDQLLFDWFMDKKNPDAEFASLVTEIKKYAQRHVST
jgi:antitoxin CptB